MNFFKKNIFLISILILGGIFRFSYLTWGYPFFFHPDENNISSSIARLSFTQWNPHFFAYGGLPIYTGFLLSFLTGFGKPSFLTITYTIRFVSATLSFLLLPSLFYVGYKMYNKTVGIIAVLLATVSVGFIQFAHFGTFEMWLTFFSLWFFYFCYLFHQHPSRKNALRMGLLAGALISIKVSSIVFLPIPLLLILLSVPIRKKRLYVYISIYLVSILGIFAVTNPFFFLDKMSYTSALAYEGAIAVGTLPVFYTQSFFGTTPILFQLTKIYPFLLNPCIELFFIPSFLFILYKTIKTRNANFLLLTSFFLLLFLSQAILFVKWTRYMVPTLPFVYLFVALALSKLRSRQLFFISGSLFCLSLLFACAFFFTVYPKDSRLAASTFPKTTKSTIIEPYDLGALPFLSVFPGGKIVNFYDLEKDEITQNQLPLLLQTSGFFLSPSQRLWHTRLTNPTDFPRGNIMYTKLFNGAYGFSIAYATPCSILCKIAYLGNPIYHLEETATVFDHPFVTIFQKK
ncbi:MAG TPA: glycosyltransferase family 39 protein [Candidatus Eisenbacteria bacterium]|nr:glycosyltransferase family 39 protein [Candidatus Eisenbacteria bacterium]